MKGISLLSDLFLLLTLIGLTIMMTLFVWYLILLYEFVITPVITEVGLSTPRELTLRLVTKPAEYDSLMLSFLELDYNGIKMKRIVNAAAIQGKTDIWLDGQNINAKSVAEGFLATMIDKDYLLKISPQEIVLADDGTLESSNTPLGIQKVSTELFLLNGEAVELQLFVRD
jgi:hypothetical protein